MRKLRQNLVFQFSVISFMVGAVAAVACIFVLSSRIQAAAVDDLIGQAQYNVSSHLLGAITPADLQGPMTWDRYEEFHQWVQNTLSGGRVARVKVWARDGTLVYSDMQEAVGQKFPNNENLIKALQGKTAAQVGEPTESEKEYESSLGALMSAYVPIVFPGTTEPQGAFEIYQYYEPTAQLIQGLQRWLILVGGTGFIFLYAGSVVIVWRGWRTIQRQEANLGGAYEALRESEELHRAVVENMAEAVAITKDAKRVFVNRAFLDIHGLQDVSQVIGKPMDWVIFPEDREMVVARSLARQRGEPVTSFYEYRVVRSDGEVRTVETLAVPLQYMGESATLAVLRDVTEDRHTARLLKENQDRLLVAQKNAKIGNWDWDLTTGALWWSEQNYEIYGFDPQEVAPSFEAFMATVEPSDEELVKTSLEEALRGGRPYNIDIHSVRPDGTKFVVNAQAKVLYDDAGKPTGMTGTVQDITERKRAEEALRESEELHRAVVENMTEGVAIARDAKRVFVNKAFLDIHGLQYASEVIGEPIDKFVSPESKEGMVARSLARQRGEPVSSFHERRILRPNGEVRIVQTQAVLIQYRGQPANLAVLRDITNERQAEEERIQYARELEKTLHRLQETQQQLVQSEKLASIGQLVAGVAHELNNPLTGVWGITELVLRRDLDNAVREDVELVHNEAARAVRIVQNLLSFARARRPERSYGSINEALEKTLELRAYEMGVSGIDLEREMQPDLPNAWFDFHQMQQVFLNIVVNAEQAMAEAHGGGKLVVRTRRVNGSIQISFTDDGPGIPKENLGRIFDPFFTTKEVGKGTGLGLSICYGIVQEHGGRIWAESEVGKGATFTVEIPMTIEEMKG